MRKRQIIILSGFLIAGVIFFTALTYRQDAQNKSNSHPDDVTTVQLGVLTDRQRQHSKLYDGRGGGEKIVDLLRTQNEVSIVWSIPSRGSEMPSTQLTQSSFLHGATCNSDVIVIGNVLSQESQITNDGYFVFTDYTINIETVLKSKNTGALKPTHNIVVSRPGGKVRVNGKLVVAIDQSSKALKIGNQYLFFMKSISGTEDFSSIEGTALIPAIDGKIDSVNGESGESLLTGSNSRTIVEQIRNSINMGCSPVPQEMSR